ncbi:MULTISPECIES: hypothetical protein [Butyricimonas]|jgi:lipoprotein|uniref:Lipoprotein n=1 Tax=Butyricimonas hominis TaxID=2763032 RepID=A0ABR7D1A0_9BACT|nr:MULTISPECIES: hypothetical protein [Butyricimonas]MBC5621674.1 hypothetical protein [Butyricimonas hominis]MCB6972846.1 hypothetical protein [Butyricimonas synergistica]MCG4518382.1 hypothetical protein [Butyricimonas sp. DFI.6.44]
MNKYHILLPIFFFIIGCNTQQTQKANKVNPISLMDSVYSCNNFLKTNIPYTASGYGAVLIKTTENASFKDNYSSRLKVLFENKDLVTIEVGIDNPITCAIKSVEYYGLATGYMQNTPLGSMYELTKLAIVKTDTGEIRIAESQGYFRTIYHFYIKIGNEEIEAGNPLLCCFLPSERALW